MANRDYIPAIDSFTQILEVSDFRILASNKYHEY
jgi:hypothetical protein